MNSRASASLLFLATALLLSGCHKPAPSGPNSPSAIDQQRAERESQREQLDMIPPPSKNRFMAIHSFDSWENPYITVQSNMLMLHVLQPDTNPSTIGAGGILRPVGARRQIVSISPDKLADAMAAIPQDCWPYGRVIAIEEAHKTPAAAEPAVRRTMESAVATLSDLGIEAYDLSDGRMQ